MVDFIRIARSIQDHTSIERNDSWSDDSNDGGIDVTFDIFSEDLDSYDISDFGPFKWAENHGMILILDPTSSGYIPVAEVNVHSAYGCQQISLIAIKSEYQRQKLGKQIFDRLLSRGPILSDHSQTPESRSFWSSLLKSGYNVSLFDPRAKKLLNVELSADPRLNEIRSDNPEFPVYGSIYLLHVSR